MGMEGALATSVVPEASLQPFRATVPGTLSVSVASSPSFCVPHSLRPLGLYHHLPSALPPRPQILPSPSDPSRVLQGNESNYAKV